MVGTGAQLRGGRQEECIVIEKVARGHSVRKANGKTVWVCVVVGKGREHGGTESRGWGRLG